MPVRGLMAKPCSELAPILLESMRNFCLKTGMLSISRSRVNFSNNDNSYYPLYSRLDRAHLRRDLCPEGSYYEIFRPGFVRVSVPYHASTQDIEYVIEAVQLVAKHGMFFTRNFPPKRNKHVYIFFFFQDTN